MQTFGRLSDAYRSSWLHTLFSARSLVGRESHPVTRGVESIFWNLARHGGAPTKFHPRKIIRLGTKDAFLLGSISAEKRIRPEILSGLLVALVNDV